MVEYYGTATLYSFHKMLQPSRSTVPDPPAGWRAGLNRGPQRAPKFFTSSLSVGSILAIIGAVFTISFTSI